MSGKSETIERVFSGVNDITSLAHYARCQAHEADLRATHALLLADRAVEESRAVRGIADSLSKTARVVAKLALENMATIDAVSVLVTLDNDVSDGNSTATASQTDIETNHEDGRENIANDLVIEDVDGSNESDASGADDGNCTPEESKDLCKDTKEIVEEDGGSHDVKEKSTLDNINALIVKAREMGIGGVESPVDSPAPEVRENPLGAADECSGEVESTK